MILKVFIFTAASLFACQAFAQGTPTATNPYSLPSTGTGAFIAKTIGTGASTVLAAGNTTTYLLLANPSVAGGNTVYCAFGSTAVVNAAGTIPVAPGQIMTFEGSYVPRDAVSCIATGASTPFTLVAQ